MMISYGSNFDTICLTFLLLLFDMFHALIWYFYFVDIGLQTSKFSVSQSKKCVYNNKW